VFFIDKNGALWSLYGPATWILFLSHGSASRNLWPLRATRLAENRNVFYDVVEVPA